MIIRSMCCGYSFVNVFCLLLCLDDHCFLIAEAKNRLIDPDQLFARQRVALQQGQQQLEQSVNQRAALMHGQV